MHSIDSKIAQDIVNRVMKVIPYNVNIMNQEGVIIASGDRSRLNKIHSGALLVLEKNKSVEIHKNTDKEKAGINLPIIFSNEMIGVIGVTGNPDDIRQFGELVRITAELLVNEHFTFSKKKAFEMHRDKFFYELTQLEGEYSEEIKRESSELGIDLDIPRIALVINIKNKDFNYYLKIKDKLWMFLEKQEFIIEYFENTLVVLVNTPSKQNIIIDILSQEELDIGVSLKENLISTAVKQGDLAIKVGKTLSKNEKVLKYEELYFLSTLTTCKGNEILKRHMEILKNEGNKLDLIDTILSYIENSGEINTISKNLNIHRNTLNYRLEKIYSLTGKNPKNFLDLLELYTSYILYN
ncbi:CdaR family transcriptional regulator [Romboutsia sp. 1001713B170207_170306_H8]|uniref:CdaR family transcriptional regulator n=1 Tax=Romboutsia sp. 1001713B170207_170306_H8 TaxID=2787112 RepID=UPI000821B84C|nr:sugar diacid recognition domain-containing protein [Romboutsia sp. 1001713B170207_170306_H8]SCI52373.1 Sugar diacid regulator [uncultured Clostridium sp.]